MSPRGQKQHVVTKTDPMSSTIRRIKNNTPSKTQVREKMNQNLRWPTYQFTPRDEEIRNHLKDLPRTAQVLRAAGATTRQTRFDAANSGHVELHWTSENEQNRQQFLAINDSDYGRYSTYHLTNQPEFITIPNPKNQVTDATLQLRLPRPDHPAWPKAVAAHQNLLEYLTTAPRRATPESLTLRARLDDAIYDMLDLRKQQRALIRDTVEYVIPKLNEPPQTADEILVALYCDRIQTQINNIIKRSGYHYQASISYAGDILPPIICYFHLGETSNVQSISTNPTANTAELIKTMPDHIAKSLLKRFQHQGNCHLVLEQQIWVAKDNLAASWCQVTALNDSNVLFSDLMDQDTETARQASL